MSRRSKKATAPRKAVATHRGGFVAPESASRHIVRNDRWMVVGVCLFLAAITWLVFGQTLRHQFVNLDDGAYVLKNAQVARGLTIEGIIWAFTQAHADNWHPLTWLSHMLDCQVYGLNPGGHHLTNVLLHASTAILLFLVLLQMTASLWRSAFVAAVFAIHPLRVESVAWVAERKDVLSGLFFMLTLWAYVRYVRGPRSPVRYGLLLLFFALGLMSKPMLVTVPIVLLLLDYWPLNRMAALGHSAGKKFEILRGLIIEKLPLLGLVAISIVVTLFAQKSALQPLEIISVPLRLGNAVISCVAYIRQMLWPSGLAAYYPFALENIVASKVLLSLVVLILISTVVFLLRRRRYLATGWLWYLIMLGPVIGILQVGSQARADRYTYLPQIGLALLLTWAAADWCARWRYHRLFLGALSIIFVGVLTFSARTQASFWKDSETLWRQALSRTTDNVMAELNFGEAVYKLGRTAEAIGHFQRALEINPNQATVYSSLGVALLETGQPGRSLSHLQKAIELDPNNGDAHYNLGNTFLHTGRATEALAAYKKALELNPNDTETLNNMAWILATWPDALTRDGTKAVELAERADSLTRGASPVISATLAAAYAEAGRSADAVKAAQRAVQLALAEGNEARAASIRAQLEFYQAGSAFRDRRSRL